MACLLLALVLTATALTVKSEPCTAQDLSHTKVPTGDKLLFANAARTTPAEAFWRTAFPGAPMPEAIRELLHARTEATTVPNDVKLMDGGDDPPPMNFNYEDYSAAASRRNGAAAPSPRVLKLSASALNNAATDGNGKAGAMSSATAFFLEDAVRVGGSLPLPIVLRTATDAPTAGLAPPRLYTVRAVRTVEEGSSSIVVCRRGRKAGGPDHDAAVPYGCRATTTLSAPKRVYAVDVAGEDKDDGDAVVLAVAVVCHTDTSRWDTGHVAFRLLGIKPGGAAVCHALPDAQVLSIENDEIIPVSP